MFVLVWCGVVWCGVVWCGVVWLACLLACALACLRTCLLAHYSLSACLPASYPVYLTV